MSLDRRTFLKLASLGAITLPSPVLTGCTHRKFYNPDQDIILGGGKFKQNDEIRQVLAIINLQQQDHQLVDLDFLAHGIIIDPKDKKRLITFENDGAGAVEVDLNEHVAARKIETSSNQYFNGHGAFDNTGETLFCTETDQNNHKGIITIRDGRNFKMLGEFPSYGERPHECQLINDGTMLVVANRGDTGIDDSKPSVAYIDVQSHKLIERVSLSDQQLNAGHIAITDNGDLIVASAPRKGLEETHPGGVSIRSGNQAMLSMSQPEMLIKQLNGEALSIALDNRNNIAAVTHPEANMVTFWSIDKRELLKAMSVPEPRGVTLSLDERSFIISYHINTSMIRVSTKDLMAKTDSIMQPSYISGSHIVNWSKTLTKIMPTNIYT